MLMVTGAVLAATAVASLAPTQAVASSHREAPLISGQPQYDNTDLYAFVSPDRPDTTTLIANWIPFEDPATRATTSTSTPTARAAPTSPTAGRSRTASATATPSSTTPAR